MRAPGTRPLQGEGQQAQLWRGGGVPTFTDLTQPESRGSGVREGAQLEKWAKPSLVMIHSTVTMGH